MHPDERFCEKLDAIGEEFTLGILRTESARHPENVEALSEYANLLTRSGRYQEGLEVDLRLAALRPTDPFVHYNLACSYAMLGEKEKAFEQLARAVELGYDDREFLLSDTDLKSLREDPRFRRILESLG